MRYAIALLMVCLATVSWYFLDQERFLFASSWLILGYIGASVLVLPLEIGIFTGAIIFALFLSLSKINETKIEMTYMPLTILDLKIAYNNPSGLLAAIDITNWALIGVYLVLIVILFLAIFLLARNFTKLVNKGLPTVKTLIGIIIFSFSALMTWQVALALASSLKTTPGGVTNASRTVGLVPFLIISYFEESKDPLTIINSNVAVLSKDRLSTIIDSYIKIDTKHNAKEIKKVPNIILIQAESTLNPNTTFKLSSPVESALFLAHPDTKVTGQLTVNAVGGGSWITEFEAITGLDSRFFGYSGYYTHATVSPYIQKSFATYLADRGYQTSTFYGVPGEFYNARRAYERYGFKNLYDSVELGIKDGWSKSDYDLLRRVITKLGSSPKAPFFAYVVSTANHSPHNCKNFTKYEQLVTTLVGSKGFDVDCRLNEYLRRLKQTELAFEAVVEYLREVESKTGRPYIVLLYGDHQPHTFISGAPKFPDFSAYRTEASKFETVFHLRSSVRGRTVFWNDAPLPASLIPSVLSSFVASSKDDLYLGMNFYLFAKCGSDFFPVNKPNGVFDEPPSDKYRDDEKGGSTGCKEARQIAWVSYQRNGQFRGMTSQTAAGSSSGP
jgi:phosphoglycerol transferase MdoB-like AlkP superfamily enzyme